MPGGEVQSSELILCCRIDPNLEYLDSALHLGISCKAKSPGVFEENLETICLVSVRGVGENRESPRVIHTHNVKRSLCFLEIEQKALMILISDKSKGFHCVLTFNEGSWRDQLLPLGEF